MDTITKRTRELATQAYFNSFITLDEADLVLYELSKGRVKDALTTLEVALYFSNQPN